MAQIPESEKKILEEINYYKDKYFTYDEPIPFHGLTIYPVTMRNYQQFMVSTACLTLNKNDDIKGLRYTNLEYLMNKLKDDKEGPEMSLRLTQIVELCLHVKNGLKCDKCGKIMTYEEFFPKYQAAKTDEERLKTLTCECGGNFHEVVKFKQDEETKRYNLIIDGVELDNEKFNRLRKIIMYQNLPDFKDDSWVDKAIRKDQEERQKLMSKGQGTASTERKMLCLVAKTNYKLEDVYDMPIRKFLKLLDVVNDAMEYETTKIGLMTGMVSLKKGETIEHWIYKKDNGMYGSAVDADSLINKINGKGM